MVLGSWGNLGRGSWRSWGGSGSGLRRSRGEGFIQVPKSLLKPSFSMAMFPRSSGQSFRRFWLHLKGFFVEVLGPIFASFEALFRVLLAKTFPDVLRQKFWALLAPFQGLFGGSWGLFSLLVKLFFASCFPTRFGSPFGTDFEPMLDLQTGPTRARESS